MISFVALHAVVLLAECYGTCSFYQEMHIRDDIYSVNSMVFIVSPRWQSAPPFWAVVTRALTP